MYKIVQEIKDRAPRTREALSAFWVLDIERRGLAAHSWAMTYNRLSILPRVS